MAERAGRVFVMTNNHYRGQAMVNALQMKAALSGEKVSAPPSLVSAYPVLKSITRPPAATIKVLEARRRLGRRGLSVRAALSYAGGFP